jgi:carboxypeptidase C (cathepsin A)
MADSISWASTSSFNKGTVLSPVAGVSVAQQKAFGGITFLQVDSAGHMVPLDQPVSSSYALQTVLDKITA